MLNLMVEDCGKGVRVEPWWWEDIRAALAL